MIDAFALWNESRPGRTSGVQNFRLFADDDGDFNNGTLGQLGTDFLALQVDFGQAFDFGATTTSFVHFQILDNYGLAGSTIFGEVAFRQVPEPLTMLGAGAAIAFGTGFKRKLGKAKQK